MKKFFSYLLTFVVMFVISAATTVYISRSGSDGNIVDPMVGVGGGANSSFFAGVIGTFEEEKRFSASGSIEIEKDGQSLPLDLHVNIDIADTSNLKIEGYIEVEINGKDKLINFAFFDNTIYLSYSDIDIKITTATINTLIQEVSNLITSETQQEPTTDHEQEAEPSFIDELVPQLMNALNNVKETELENGDKKVELEVEGLAKVEAVTTDDNKPKRVKLKTEEIEGFKLNADINLNFNNDLVILSPESGNFAKDYFDLKQLYSIIKNTAELRNFNASALLTLSQGTHVESVGIDCLANINDGNYAVNLTENTFGYLDNASVAYLNNNLYINTNNIKILASDKLIENLSSLAQGMIAKILAEANIQLDTSGLTEKIEESIASIDQNQILNIINMIKEYDIEEDGIVLKVDASYLDHTQGLIEFKVGFDGDYIKDLKISGININGAILDFELEINQTQNKVGVENKDEYLDLYSLYQSNKDFFGAQALDIDLDVKCLNLDKNLAIDSNFKFDLQETYFELGAKLTGSCGADLYVVYDKDTAYLTINDIKIKTTRAYVEHLVSNLSLDKHLTEGAQDLTNTIKAKLSTFNTLDVLSLLGAVKNIELSSEGLKIEASGNLIGLSDDITFQITLVNDIVKSISIIGFEYQGNKADLTLVINTNTITKAVLDKGEYLDVEKFINGLTSIVNAGKGTVYANTSINLDGRDYKANMILSGDISQEYMTLALALNGEFQLDSEITYKNDRVYLGVEDIKVSASNEFILNIIGMLTAQGGLKLSNFENVLSENETINNIINFTNSLTIDSLSKLKNIIVSSSHIEIIFDKSIFGSEDDLIFRLELYQSNPREIEFINVTMSENLKVSFKASYNEAVINKNIDDNDYLNIDKFIDGITNIVNADSFYVNGQLDIKSLVDGETLAVMLDARSSKEGEQVFDLENSYYSFTANISGNEDIDVSVCYDQEIAYVTLNNIKLKMSKHDAEKLIESLNANGQIEKISTDIINEIQAKLAGLSIESLAYIMTALNKVVVTGNNIYIELDGAVLGINSVLQISLDLKDSLISGIEVSGVNLNNQEISADIDFEINSVQKLEINKKEYLDVIDVVNKIITLQNLREATINASLSAVIGGESYFADVYFSGSLDEEYAKLVMALTGGIELDLSAIYHEDILYANVEDVFVSVSKDFISKLIGLLNVSMDNFDVGSVASDINNLAIITNFISFIDNIEINDMKLIKKLIVNSNEVKITLDKSVLGCAEDTTLCVYLNNNNIERVTTNVIDIDENMSIAIDVTLEQQAHIEEPNASKYLNVDKVYENIIALQDLREATIDASLSAVIGGESYFADVYFSGSLDEEYAKLVMALTGGIELDLSAIYHEDILYANVEEIFVSISKNFIGGLLGSINIPTDSFDMTELTTKASELAIVHNVKSFIGNISLDSLKLIKELVINSNEIKITIDKSVLGCAEDTTLCIYLNNNNIARVTTNVIDIDENISIAIDVTLEQQVHIEEPNASKYLNVDKVYENVLALQYLREATINANVNAQISGKTYGANIDLVGSLDDEYLKLILALTGDANLDADIRIVENVIYLGVQDIWLSLDIATIENLLTNVGIGSESLSTDNIINELIALDIVGKIKEFICGFNFESLKLVKNVVINSSIISLDLDKTVLGSEQDVEIRIDIVNNDIQQVTLNNIKVNDKINISLAVSISKQIVKENVEQSKYLDIENFVSGLEGYVGSNLLQLVGEMSLYSKVGEDYTETMSLSLDMMKRKVLSDLMGYLNLDLVYDGNEINLETHYLKETLFASVGGLKVGIEKDGLKDSIQTILSMLEMDVNAYDAIIDKVIAVLNGENILDVLDVNIVIEGTEVIDATTVDIEAIIKELLSGVEINANGITLNIDGTVFGLDAEINATLVLEGGKVSQITINKLKVGDNYINLSLALAQEDKLIPEFTEEDEATYMSVSEAVNTIEKVYDTIKNGTVSGDINLEIELFGEVNLINIVYGVKYVEGELSAYIQTNFKGLDVNMYLIGGVFYLDVVGMKIKVAYNELNDIVDWLNGEFNLGLNINFDEIENALSEATNEISFDVSQIIDLVNNTDFSFMENIIFGKNSLEGTIAGTTIFVVYDELVKQVTFRKGTMFAELNCTSYDDFTLKAVNKDEYNSYTVLTDAYNSVNKTINAQQYSLDANAKVIANEEILHNINIDLDLDILNTIKMYADVVVEGTMPTLVTAAYQNDVLYANYENLKLSIHQYNLREILVVVLETLGVDAKAISFLGDVAENMEVSSDNLTNIIPALDFGNPLNMLKLIKHITINNSVFTLLLDGKAILDHDSATDMTVNIKLTENGVGKVELLNIYTGQENGEIFNLIIDFKEFSGVPDVQNPETYIDISDSSQLIKAFVNTSNLNDYTITGNIKIVANIIGINIDMDVPVVVKVKILENGEIIVYAHLDIPVVGSNVPGFTGINVNNDVPYEFGDTSIESRKLEIMIKDGFVYMYRYDVVKQTVFANRIYEKQMKVSLEEFSWGLTDYLLSYGVGLSDQIMAEIDKAFDKATHREDNPLDISNVLLGYSKQENADVHQIVINLCEIANNELMDRAAIDIHVINNSSTSNKDYIGKLVFDMNMPLASGVDMNIKTNDLSLVDIGKSLDMSYVNNFISNYGYKENQQYERVDGGAWEFAGEKQYTINFVDSMGNTPSSITATVESSITLPTLSTIVQDKDDGRYTYTFAGWYTTENFKDGTEFTSTVMPRGDRTLYAKWNESVVPKVTLSFNTMGGEVINSITQLVGSVVNLPVPANKVVVDGQIKITYGFAGWFADESCQERFRSAYMPNENTTLYAGWEEIDRYVAYNLKVIDNGNVVFDKYIGEGLTIELSGFKIDSYTQYYLDQSFATRYIVSTMPSSDLTLYVRNRYALNIVSVHGNIYDTTEYHYQGDSYALPSQNTHTTDDGSKRVTYTFNGYDGASSVMPNANHKIVANWTVVIKYYYTVTFELAYDANVAYHKQATLYKNGVKLGTNSIDVKVLEGTLNLNEYTADWKYTTGSWIFEVNWWYDFYGFSTSKDGSTTSSINVTGNTTIYGVWSGLKSS